MTTYFSTPNNGFRYPAGVVGEAPDPAGDMKQLATDIDTAVGKNSDWQNFTPGMTNIAYSNVSACAYRRINGLVLVTNKLTGNVNVGSGRFLLGLPVAAETASGFKSPFFCDAFYVHAGQRYRLQGSLNSPTALEFTYLSGSPVTETPFTSTAPFTPVNGDEFDISYLYRPA